MISLILLLRGCIVGGTILLIASYSLFQLLNRIPQIGNIAQFFYALFFFHLLGVFKGLFRIAENERFKKVAVEFRELIFKRNSCQNVDSIIIF